MTAGGRSREITSSTSNIKLREKINVGQGLILPKPTTNGLPPSAGWCLLSPPQIGLPAGDQVSNTTLLETTKCSAMWSYRGHLSFKAPQFRLGEHCILCLGSAVSSTAHSWLMQYNKKAASLPPPSHLPLPHSVYMSLAHLFLILCF